MLAQRLFLVNEYRSKSTGSGLSGMTVRFVGIPPVAPWWFLARRLDLGRIWGRNLATML